MSNAVKSAKRLAILSYIVDGIDADLKEHSDIYERLLEIIDKTYNNFGEDATKTPQDCISVNASNQEEDYYLFGFVHWNDFVLRLHNMSVAINFSYVDRYDLIYSNVGKAILNNSKYDFTVCVINDTTEDGSIKESIAKVSEREIVNSLWENHNILVMVVRK